MRKRSLRNIWTGSALFYAETKINPKYTQNLLVLYPAVGHKNE